jgi:hypothetical protein
LSSRSFRSPSCGRLLHASASVAQRRDATSPAAIDPPTNRVCPIIDTRMAVLWRR